MQLSVLSALLLCGAVSANFDPQHASLTLDYFKKNTGTVLNELNTNRGTTRAYGKDAKVKNFNAMLQHIVKLDGKYQPKTASHMTTFLSSFTKELLEEYKEFLAPGLGYYLDTTGKNSTIKKFFQETHDRALEVVQTYKARQGRNLAAIDISFVTAAGADMLATLADSPDNNPAVLYEMPKAFWEAFKNFSVEDQKAYCGGVNATFVGHMNRNTLPGITPACFAGIQGVGDAVIDEKIRFMRDDIFAYFGFLNEKNAAVMKDVQLANYGINKEASTRCANLALNKVTPGTIKKVTAACLASYLIKDKAEPLLALWKNIPVNIFDGLKKDEFLFGQVVKAIRTEDKEFMSKDQLNSLLDTEAGAANLPEGGDIKPKMALTMTPENLAKIQDKNVLIAVITTTETLDPYILSHLTAKHFDGVSVTRRGAPYEGLAVLDLMTVANQEACIKNLSSKIETGEHACSLIADLSTYKTIKSLKYASVACTELFTFPIDLAAMKSMPFLVQGRPFEDIASEFNDDEYAKMKPELLKAIATGDFCSVVTKEIFVKINKDALSVLDGSCLGAMSFVSEISNLATYFADNTFETTDVSQWNTFGFALENINDKQLALLSEKVDKSADMVTATLTVADIKALGKRVSVFTAKKLASLKPETIGAIVITEIKPAALRQISAEQITAMLPSFVDLSAEQVENIGADNTDAAAVNKVLEANKAKLNKDAFAAWVKRSTTNPTPIPEAESSIPWGWIIIGILAVVVIGGAVIFFVRK